MEPAVGGDHGRIETRTVAVVTATDRLADHRRPGLEALRRIVRRRETGDEISTQTAFGLLSTALSPRCLNEVTRLEGLREPPPWAARRRPERGSGPHPARQRPQSIAVLRDTALNVMWNEGSKGSLRGRFKRAGWTDADLPRLRAAF